jgi:hypothetical protein
MILLKKRLLTFILTLTIFAGGISIPSKNANAGVIVGVAASTSPVLPVALAVAGHVFAMGAVITSVYWAIDNRDKAWWAWGLFMLDEEIANNQTTSIISAKYPQLDQYMVDELASMIEQKSQQLDFSQNTFNEIVFSKNELSSVLSILNEVNPELSQQIEKDLTTKAIKQ